MLRKPAIFFVASFVFGFILTNFATPALAWTRIPRRNRITIISSSPTPKPTASPHPSPTPSPTLVPSPTPKATPIVAAAVVDAKSYMMNEINNFRKSKGLSEVKTNTETCSFAKIRASEITTNFSHTGFRDRINSKSLPYPSYSQVTENIAETWDYKRVVGLWINSPGHRENMEKDTPFVCVEQNSNFYAYEGWKP